MTIEPVLKTKKEMNFSPLVPVLGITSKTLFLDLKTSKDKAFLEKNALKNFFSLFL